MNDPSAPLYAALRDDPRNGRAHLELGRLLEARGKSALAIIHFQTASVLEPDYAPALVALGDAYMARGKAKPALAAYDRALRADPYDPEAHFHEALTKLALGSFGRGWRDFEWRWRAPGAALKETVLPAWNGKARQGARVLVYGEAMPIEEIFYAHALTDLVHAGVKILFRGEASLAHLFARSVPGLEAVAPGASLPSLGVDGAIGLGTLPALFRRRKADFDRPPGYLKADPHATAGWRAFHRTQGRGLILGLAWRGALAWPNARPFDLPAAALKPLTTIPGAVTVALEQASDVAAAAHAGLSLAAPLARDDSLDGLAARIDGTDLVVTPPGPIAALAGALGKPVYVLAPTAPGWPWLLSGRRNPWFPTMAMIRLRAAPRSDDDAATQDLWRDAAEDLAVEIGAGIEDPDDGDDAGPSRGVGFVTEL